MSREIRLNAFDMNCVGHQSPGLWAHPRDRSWQYKDLEYWTDLAKILERGKFDGLFIADVLGIYDVYNGNGDAAIRQATQVPVNDPLSLIAPMALVTEHLGFGLTASLSFEHPYPFARRLSTLDHLPRAVSAGISSLPTWKAAPRTSARKPRPNTTHATTTPRNTWRFATSFGKAVGRRARYCATASGGFSVIRAKSTRSDTSANTSRCPAFTCASRRRSARLVLYQAGASSRGKQFAAEQAECVFVAAPSKVLLKKTVADIRRRAAEAGRDPKKILIFNLQTVIVDETDAKAKAKFDDYKSYVSYEGAMALISGWTGIDFSQLQTG